jgi:hypothetical protein
MDEDVGIERRQDSARSNQAHSFKVDKTTAGALLDLFWVKGARRPTERPSEGAGAGLPPQSVPSVSLS